MLKYIAKRLCAALVSMFIVITVVFLLMRLMPVEGYFGGRAPVRRQRRRTASSSTKTSISQQNS